MEDSLEKTQSQSQVFRERWLSELYPDILLFFKRRLLNQSDAHDLAQETVLKILRYFNEYDVCVEQGDYCAAFVFRSARNVLRDFLRKCSVRKTNQHVAWDDDSETFLSTCSRRSPAGPLQDMEMLCTYTRLALKLNSLNDRTKNVFVLSRVAGLKSRDIANLENISISSVEKHLSKAKSALQDILCEESA